MKNAIAETIAEIFPFWHKLDSNSKSDFLNQGQYVNLPGGQFICLEGDPCHHLPLVISGNVRTCSSSLETSTG